LRFVSIRLSIVATVCFAAATLAVTQGQTPASTAPTQPTGGGGTAPQQPAPAPGRGRADQPGADFLPRPPVQRLTPEAEQRLFLLPDGFHVEKVLADPDIEDPVGVTFDGNGRMYVLEMRSYMRDADGSNSREPISRISRWEDTDGDGVYDKHTVFADKLVMPRIAFPLLDGELLVLETDHRDLEKFTDTDGDGIADKKEVFYAGFGRVQNMEWQPGGLTWALDNWLYSTYNPFRLRLAPGGKILREETEPNGGQWWSAQDDYGKTWWVDGGGEIGPVNIQQPIQYGAFNAPDNFEPNFQAPNGAPIFVADMQGGMNRVRVPDGSLNHFTAAAGVEIYRGDRLPKDLMGDLFFNEPVGRIVRRAKVLVADGMTQLKNAYPGSEFIRSTDPLFRPVCIVNAPDGTLYLMDMYTGIIQDAQFVGPGSYLRRKVEQYQLDRAHNFGRIWRITYDGMSPDRTMPRMYGETPSQLVEHLAHPNGWWRDTAQKLLVLKQDKAVVPALKAMAQGSANHLARIHALWTVEGLLSLDATLVRSLMKDPDPQMRIQAIRASESLYKGVPGPAARGAATTAGAAKTPASPSRNGDLSFANDWRALTNDPDPDVVIQAMLTLNVLRVPQATELIRAKASASAVRGIKEIGSQILQPGRSMGQGPALADAGAGNMTLTVEQRRILQRGESTYRELCFTCHGNDGKGAPVQGAGSGTTLAPALSGSPRVTGHRNYVIGVLVDGLAGPVDGKEYNGGAVMVPMGTNSDDWIADVANYVRNNFGNSGTFVTAADVAAVRKASTRKAPWTVADLSAAVPAPLANSAQWKLTASHNADAAPNAIGTGGARWDTGAPQAAGMWFQIELPEVTTITEVQIDAMVPGARGRGAFGGGPAAGGRGPASAPAGAPPIAAGPPRGGGRGGPAASGPTGYSIQVSTTGTAWGVPVASGTGATPTTIAAFGPVAAKFIRITQTGAAQNGEWWAIQQVRVYAAAKK
jgi:mono/diheme cytochrome c family protein